MECGNIDIGEGNAHTHKKNYTTGHWCTRGISAQDGMSNMQHLLLTKIIIRYHQLGLTILL